MVRDIRDGPQEQYWQRLREMMGSSGLLTYWYLGRGFNQIEDPDTMRLRSDMRNATGGIMAAPLAIAAPETGGWRDREVVPAPVAYGLHILDAAREVATVRVTRTTVRRGRKMGFSRSEIVDADDPQRVIAITTGIGVTLGDAPPVSLPSIFRPSSPIPTTCRPSPWCSARRATPTAGAFRDWVPSTLRRRRRCTSDRSTSCSKPQRWKRWRRRPERTTSKPRTGTSTSSPREPSGRFRARRYARWSGPAGGVSTDARRPGTRRQRGRSRCRDVPGRMLTKFAGIPLR